jgi:ATP-dependent DNA helicase DinG
MDNSIPHALDAVPALVATFRRALLATADGRFAEPSAEAALAAVARTPHLTAHTTMTLLRLGGQRNEPRAAHFDVLDLFSFVRPAQPIAPSVGALARAMGLASPQSLAEQAITLREVAERLLDESANMAGRPIAARIAAAMGQDLKSVHVSAGLNSRLRNAMRLSAFSKAV